jgi:hypothetical protein
VVWTIEASNEWPFRYPKNTVPSSATPIAPPSCCAVLNNPDAPPAASTGTAASTTLTSGMTSSASPAPHTTDPNERFELLIGIFVDGLARRAVPA